MEGKLPKQIDTQKEGIQNSGHGKGKHVRKKSARKLKSLNVDSYGKADILEDTDEVSCPFVWTGVSYGEKSKNPC